MSQAGILGTSINPSDFVQVIDGNTGSATPVGGIVNIVGAGNIDTTGVGDTLTITLAGTTDHAVQVGNAAGSLTSIPVGLTGQVLTGVTGGDPVFAAPASTGVQTVTGGLNITITGTATDPIVSASQAQLLTNYSVANASPYVVTATDFYITVDTSTIPITIQLPNAPTIYRRFVIKDSAGNAAVQNVTVTTVGGVLNIDAAPTFVMNTNYEAIELVYDGFGYQVF